MTRHIVGTTDEIGPGQRKIVEIDGRSIGVFNVGGHYYALRNRCPHAGARLCDGVLTGLVTSSTPGEYTYLRGGEILRCPWHGWEFDIATGRSWFDPARTRVRAYEATVEPADADLSDAGYRPGPYSAERYDVEVHRQFVVVHV
ncbi:3-phenylpropionate/trans-cinnamate dioxygenase ferredoxin subunit [Pseudonocardia hierapolitana]|uniref:3-phenylpropionate/trans-cinnamate dioxygenase ferredoxin subunit n=1 Tax=Pseudonocardia hierapolitana TaxID=1128676 RepID=A0A561T0I6_9PSEU|nr:Rieske (2Fe-2S) protein [Pseudonocardia hierapolitana]TWF80613.1 3-phenylpropionate/trans-cinnamate dioxygenase ferredoxin subunit [Pseudonocardia hierapolitana]